MSALTHAHIGTWLRLFNHCHAHLNARVHPHTHTHTQTEASHHYSYTHTHTHTETYTPKHANRHTCSSSSILLLCSLRGSGVALTMTAFPSLSVAANVWFWDAFTLSPRVHPQCFATASATVGMSHGTESNSVRPMVADDLGPTRQMIKIKDSVACGPKGRISFVLKMSSIA